MKRKDNEPFKFVVRQGERITPGRMGVLKNIA